MRVGLTYDLRSGADTESEAEYDAPETIDALAGAIARAGHEPLRVGGLGALLRALASGERWDLVFNIAEGRGGFGREAQVPAVLDAYAVPYTFSDPLTLCVALHKGVAKSLVRDAGLATAEFAVVDDARTFEALDLPVPLFVKPVAEGSGIGVSARGRIRDRAELARVGSELLLRYHQPVLVERYLGGPEYTVGVLGTGHGARAIGTLAVESRGACTTALTAYGHEEKERYEEHVSYRLVEGEEARPVEALALAVHRALRCRDLSRVDVRCDEAGTPHFLEINPLPGLHPVRSDIVILARARGLDYPALIATVLEETLRRLDADAS
jgi:D-alanine-D-alanine ligase